MSEFDNFTSQGDSNNSDNDFEKLDPFAATPDSPEDLVTSTQDAGDDFFNPSPAADASEPAEPVPEESPQLVDFGFSDPTPKSAEPSAPSPPDSTEVSEEKPQEQAIVLPPKKSAVSTDSSSWIKSVDPRVIDLIYWRDIKKSGVVFGSLLVLLFSLALFSVLSVVAYLALAALTVTTTFVIYKKVLGAVQKAGDSHPFKAYLEFDINLPEEKLHQLADVIMKNSTSTVKELRRLFLVEDLVDSLKFGLLLWVLTYIGAWFNGMTLIILIVVGVFTIPKVYETYKVQIDQYVDLARTQIKKVMTQIQEKLPLPGKKKKEE